MYVTMPVTIMKTASVTSLVMGGCLLLTLLGALDAASIAVGHPCVTAKRPFTGRIGEKYENLREANVASQSKQRLIEEFQTNAHCPFQISRENNIIRIFCDRSKIQKCTDDVIRCKDISDNCYQAYDYVTDFSPYNNVARKRKVEVGCIYHPKRTGLSVPGFNTGNSYVLE